MDHLHQPQPEQINDITFTYNPPKSPEEPYQPDTYDDDCLEVWNIMRVIKEQVDMKLPRDEGKFIRFCLDKLAYTLGKVLSDEETERYAPDEPPEAA